MYDNITEAKADGFEKLDWFRSNNYGMNVVRFTFNSPAISDHPTDTKVDVKF